MVDLACEFQWIRDLETFRDRTVQLRGRITSVRRHGQIAFSHLLDRTGSVQLVWEEGQEPPPVQSVIACRGTVVQSSGERQQLEVRVQEFHEFSRPVGNLPFDPQTLPPPSAPGGPSPEVFFDNRVVSLRSPVHAAIVTLTSQVLAAVDEYCRAFGFVEIKTAKLVSGGTEGGANMFEVRYFDRLAYLAQSPQLYKQAMASTPVERVFEVAPAFRSEKHQTIRHLNEFTSIDLEQAFVKDMHDLMDREEALLRHIIQHASTTCTRELELLQTTLPRITDRIPRLTLDEAKEISTGKPVTRANPAEDLTAEDEENVCAWAAKTHGCDAVFVHSFPTRGRPFYTKPLDENPRRSCSFDLLLRGLEISSGSIRIHDYATLVANLRRQGLNPDDFTSYLDIFRTGCPPHGGFGIGLERLVARMLDIRNVRYTTLFPRDRNRLTP